MTFVLIAIDAARSTLLLRHECLELLHFLFLCLFPRCETVCTYYRVVKQPVSHRAWFVLMICWGSVQHLRKGTKQLVHSRNSFPLIDLGDKCRSLSTYNTRDNEQGKKVMLKQTIVLGKHIISYSTSLFLRRHSVCYVHNREFAKQWNIGPQERILCEAIQYELCTLQQNVVRPF